MAALRESFGKGVQIRADREWPERFAATDALESLWRLDPSHFFNEKRFSRIPMEPAKFEECMRDLILNGKGGVGKSFFAINFIQYLKDKQIAHRAIDTDDNNSTLKRFHPEALFVDLANPHDLDTIVQSLDKTELVVVDCRAASTNIFLEYFERINAAEVFAELNASMTAIMPVNHEADSLDQIQVIVDALGTNSHYVVLRNQSHSQSFAYYERSEVRARLTVELGAKEITMTRLEDWLVEALSHKSLTPTGTSRDHH